MGQTNDKMDADNSDKKWKEKNEFPTMSIQPLPSVYQDNRIIYSTRYEPNNRDLSGIFQFDTHSGSHKPIKLWNNIKYYPRWNTVIYSKIKDELISVGGSNVMKSHDLYTMIACYKLKEDVITMHDFEYAISANAKLALTNNDTYLHIIGGNQNSKHILYNLLTNETSIIHSFDSTNPNIQEQAVIHDKVTNKLIMFGGIHWKQKKLYDDFWMLDLNKTADILVTGYVRETFLKHKDNYYDILANVIIIAYLGRDRYFSQWQNYDNYKLPEGRSSFGYVFYDNRILIAFGGDKQRNIRSSDIFYLELNSIDGWKECKMKLPQPGGCNAVLIHKTIHILPYYDYKNHYCIHIKDLLPSELIDKQN